MVSASNCWHEDDRLGQRCHLPAPTTVCRVVQRPECHRAGRIHRVAVRRIHDARREATAGVFLDEPSNAGRRYRTCPLVFGEAPGVFRRSATTAPAR